MNGFPPNFFLVGESSLEESGLLCSLCYEVMRSPTYANISSACQHSFCESCVKQSVLFGAGGERSLSCPMCSSPVMSVDKKLIPNTVIARELEGLSVECLKCGESGVHSDSNDGEWIKKHLVSCCDVTKSSLEAPLCNVSFEQIVSNPHVVSTDDTDLTLFVKKVIFRGLLAFFLYQSGKTSGIVEGFEEAYLQGFQVGEIEGKAEGVRVGEMFGMEKERSKKWGIRVFLEKLLRK